MSITYPTSLDNFPNPQSTDLLDNSSPTLDHWTQHSNTNDAIEALEAKVGIDGSAVTSSFDYKLSGVTGSDKAVSKTGTETLTNKTLTSPIINVGSDASGDMYYRNASGAFTRLPLGASGTIISSNGTTPEFIANPSASDASTTVKGVVELATLAETLAKTATGGTGAKLVVTPDNMNSTLTYDYAADSVGSDAYAITLTPAPTAYVTGQRFTFKASTANTGACSLNVNSLGAKTIKKNVSSDMSTGDILANQIVEVVYDGTNMQFVSAKSQGTTYSNGTTTKDASDASATQTIAHGLGIVPKNVRITALINTINTNGNGLQFGQAITTYNGTTQSSISTTGTSNTTSTITTSFRLTSAGGDNSTSYTTGVLSFDSTNISIAWTKTGGPTGIWTLLWEAQA